MLDSFITNEEVVTLVETVAPQIEYAISSENHGHCVVEPLENGFGVTLGNALRRVLLSSLPGAAVIAVKIEEIQHEFSTIPHVKEDTTEFLLNVKELRLRSLSQQPGRLTLEAAGEGRVLAGDIKPSADFEIVNPELHLATLDSAQAKLNVEFYVELGKGYQPASHTDGFTIGTIPVDAIFTPVRSVSYTVEPARVGQKTRDRLILDVWTDGTISPTEAVSQSAQILVNELSRFSDLGKAPAKGPAKQPLAAAVSAEQYDMPIEQLGLSARTYNCLRRDNITKVGELLEKSTGELMTIRNFGQRSLDEVQQHLQALGLIPSEEKEAEVESEVEPGVEADVGEEGS